MICEQNDLSALRNCPSDRPSKAGHDARQRVRRIRKETCHVAQTRCHPVPPFRHAPSSERLAVVSIDLSTHSPAKWIEETLLAIAGPPALHCMSYASLKAKIRRKSRYTLFDVECDATNPPSDLAEVHRRPEGFTVRSSLAPHAGHSGWVLYTMKKTDYIRTICSGSCSSLPRRRV